MAALSAAMCAKSLQLHTTPPAARNTSAQHAAAHGTSCITVKLALTRVTCRCRATDTNAIRDHHQWWRVLSSMFLSAGGAEDIGRCMAPLLHAAQPCEVCLNVYSHPDCFIWLHQHLVLLPCLLSSPSAKQPPHHSMSQRPVPASCHLGNQLRA
jgi:hypothetical protein